MVSDGVEGYHVAWSGPVTVISVETPDSGMTINGNPPAAVNQLDATHTYFDASGDVAPGRAWSLTAQPNWLGTPPHLPQSGTTT